MAGSLNDEGLQNPIDVWYALCCLPKIHIRSCCYCHDNRRRCWSSDCREHEGRYLVTTRRCKRLEALVFSEQKEVNVRVLGRKPDDVPTNKYEAFELTKAKFQSRAGDFSTFRRSRASVYNQSSTLSIRLTTNVKLLQSPYRQAP